MEHNNHGFTIVELLIVIVVIGILAAITVVAFNGVQKNATDTAVKNDLAQVAKKMELFRTTSPSDRYPVSVSELEAADLRFSQQNYQVANADGTPRNGLYYWVAGASSSDAIYGKGYILGTSSKSGTAICLINGAVKVATCNNNATTEARLIEASGSATYVTGGHQTASGWQSWTQ